MKKVLNFLKKNRLPVPISLGLLIARIPYSQRPSIGKLYKEQQQAIDNYSHFTVSEKQDYIYRQFMKIFRHAWQNVKFYQDLYKKHDITPEDIRNYYDIQKVPIITKQDLIGYDIEDRSYPMKNRLIVNTGGSSGKSLAFYMDPQRYGNEWAHIHNMWAQYGYSSSDLKLSFDGRSKKKNKIVYDFARNSLLYDIYADPKVISKQLLKTIKKHPVKYLHGYPSAIYEFAIYCENDVELLEILRAKLKAVFLSSEYPSPQYRNKIEEVFKIPTQSFYGHTETCILAVETENFLYEVYQTYGHAEAVMVGSNYHLIGTSYFNFASPLIRYDTSDLIEPLDFNSEILHKFKIKEGRSGEFILDKNNKKIPLTGLIYGRHHKLFNVCQHLQVYQKHTGEAVICYVTEQDLSEDRAGELFDSQSIAIDFTFKKIDKPILSPSGKTNLLINEIRQ